MNSQFKKGILEMCILKLIDDKQMYGYEVIETLSSIIDVSENTVYPILRRLTTLGYFDIHMEETQYGAPRKYYLTTLEGKKALKLYQDEWSSFLSGVMKIMEEKQ